MTRTPFHLRRDTRAPVSAPRTTAGQARLSFRGRVIPGAPRDAGSVPDVVDPDELVCITYGDGSQWWQRADDLLRERGSKQAERGFEGGLWTLDSATDPILGEDSVGERGVLSAVIKVFDFFGVDLDAAVADKSGELLEKRGLKGREGLYRVAVGDTLTLSEAPVAGPVAAGVPVLIFLHGTFSSMEGSYGALWDDKNVPGAQALRAALSVKFGAEIYAFEHRSLTHSPIRNALALAQHLPAHAQLHLVSHSRGGLVGDLICLAQRRRSPDPLAGSALASLFKTHPAAAEALGLDELDERDARTRQAAHDTDVKALADLLALLDRLRPTVTRFARVACPANGTTLASGRVDRWLNVINLLMPDTLFGDSLDFLFSVLKNKTDPRTLPGLEAMMPGSALTQLMRAAGLETDADLSVIAGDVEPEVPEGASIRFKLARKLALRAADRLFADEHDFVVNSRSMLGGLRRASGQARYNVDRGLDVNHFSYFKNKKSLAWLQQALLRGDGEAGSFRPMAASVDTLPPLRSLLLKRSGDSAKRPFAVLLPGTMGSVLKAAEDEVWLNHGRLLIGQIDRITIDRNDITPVDLIGEFYGPLAQHLQRTHQVHLLPYDWRRSVTEAAARLRDKLKELLPTARSNGQPIHIVAHSMGGLVARAMIADTRDGGAEVWSQVCALPNSRLLMLGTPNRGSHEAVRWLTGFNPTQIKLSLLDFTRTTYGLIKIVQAFPGLLELLPSADARRDFADIAMWQRLHAEVGQGWPLADAARLRGARSTWQTLAGSAVDPAHMIYVAGCQPQTVADFDIEFDDVESGRVARLGWKASAEGDGTVLWSSGRLKDVPMYYAPDTAHDELCSNTRDARIFRGYVELLLKGQTEQLPSQPPAAARRDLTGPAGSTADALFPLQEPPAIDALPDEADTRQIGFSGSRRRRRQAVSRPAPTIEVSVTHGNLAFAKNPVLVGHYLGDTIVSAERALDDRLDGQLTKRLALGLYPGRIGSHAVFYNRDRRSPRQAYVVGLGQVGELAPGLLETSVRDLLLDVALRRLQDVAAAHPDSGAPPPLQAVRFSSLLVGTGASALKARDSIEAILRGAVAANRKLEAAELDGQVLIDRIEFLELYEDIALGAARALDQLLDGSDLQQVIEWPARVVRAADGRRQRRHFDEDPSWWQRLEIVEDADTGQLRFIATTDRARAEETMSPGQLELADQFVARASATAARDPDIAKTLFEMLVPRRIKESTPEQRDMVLLVDEKSARFPWELLEDRWSQSGRPLAVAGGLVRQLKTREFRNKPLHATENSVYVVGDPDLADWAEVAQLPGAAKEAWAVKEQLERSNFRTVASVGEDAQSILTGLHSSAWRVLHLAGHGVHDYQTAEPAQAGVGPVVAPVAGQRARRGPVSGMVIGRNTFLTPGDVEQLRHVPELVFINCCHLGQTRSVAGHDLNRLAANLGVQFINMGVKAVIAAGWAVDDEAALTFAQRFYEGMLTGEPFGVAVREARTSTFDRHPGANTWGAYQCYGDPAFRLSSNTPASGPQTPARFYAPPELIAELGNLLEGLRAHSHDVGADPIATETLGRQIDALLARVPADQKADWLARADVAAALGFVWGEQGHFEQAVLWLETALKGEKGDCPIRVVEQCANFQIRLAALQWQRQRSQPAAPRTRGRAKAAATPDARTTIERGLRELDVICQRAETTERLNLLSSACKRLAWVCDDDKIGRGEALVNMQQYSRRAMALQQRHKPGGFDAYSFTNWAVAGLLIDGPAAPADSVWRTALAASCEDGITQTRELDQAHPNVWNATGQADLAVVQLLNDGMADAATADARMQSAIRQYRLAFQRAASPREKSSVIEHLDFVADLLHDGWPAALREAVVQIKESL